MDAGPGHQKENIMEPTVSVCRKGNDLYLSLEGDFNNTSSQEMIQALKNLVMTSLKCSAPDSQVGFTFKTRGKVNCKKQENGLKLIPWGGRRASAPKKSWQLKIVG